MRKIFLILPVITVLLSSCYSNNFIKTNEYVISGVVKIENIKDDTIIPITPLPNGPGLAPAPQSGEDDNSEAKFGLGTGFIIAPNVIVTNYHVISGNKQSYKIYGYNDMKPYIGHLIAGNKEADIAILKIDDWDDFNKFINPTILTWGNSYSLEQGEKVWAIGHPYGFAWSLSSGIISSLLRQDPNGNQYYLQTDTSINPGNSGGPLFNFNGEVVGINSAIYGNKGYLGLVIPGDYAKKVVHDLLSNGKINEGKIGIVMRPSNDLHHVIVDSILKTSNSIDAGLLPNDVINAIYNSTTGNTMQIKLPQELQFEVRTLEPGDIISLYITRDNFEHKTITFAIN
jgi:serine protease Do